MHIVGIVCEYNPFHTGHAWQIAELRRRFGDDTGIVCAMSGNYVQRGDFAVVRKHIRAEAAVYGGADLVLELPLSWAIASAEGFARGGVEVLAGTGLVDTLAFGSECADTALLQSVAECLLTGAFAEALRSELKSGDSFAAARERAAAKLLGPRAAVLRAPNDILGVEYCKALPGSGLTPLALPREGSAHAGEPSGPFAPGSYIRERMAEGDAMEQYLPAGMRRLMQAERDAGRAPVRIDTAERAILAKLRTVAESELARFDEGGEGLYHRLYACCRAAAGIRELLDAVKTKRYARARLRRMLLSVYLDARPSERPEHMPYIRVLAMSEKGKSLLRRMRESARLPVLIKPADVRKLSPDAVRLMELEARATDLYALAYPDLCQSGGGSEWRTSPVIVRKTRG